MTVKRRIVIAGAGLGGLTAACRLARDGHDVEIYERAESLSIASGAIFVRSNGVRCFYRWQLREAFEAVVARIENHEARNGVTNQFLSSVDTSAFSTFPEWSTDREALQNVLYEQACQAGAQIHFGNGIVDVAEDNDRALLTCENGTRLTADLFLAADGISSRLRPKILSNLGPSSSEAAVVYAGACHYPAKILHDTLVSNETTKVLSTEPDSKNSLIWAGQGGYVVGKYNQTRRLFDLMFSIRQDVTDGKDGAGKEKLFKEDGDLQAMREFFKPYHSIVNTMAQMVDKCSLWRLARLRPLNSWSSPRRRLVLLGDSAHAMLPNLAEGFSCIVEDVDALSLMLESGNGKMMADIICEWEQLRIPRVKRIQDGSLFNYELYNNGKAPGEELTEEERNRPMGHGDRDAPFNSQAFQKWLLDYDTAEETRIFLETQIEAQTS